MRRTLSLLALTLLLLSTPAGAATFTVDSSDTNPGTSHDIDPADGVCATRTGACTLPAAIEQADALGGANPHTIQFAPAVTTLTLAGVFGSDQAAAFALPKVTAAISLAGQGTVTIQHGTHPVGTAAPTIFLVDGGSLALHGLTLTDGASPNGPFGGSGVVLENGGAATLDACRLHGLHETAVAGQGGALGITGTTFDGNSGTQAGAILTDGVTVVIGGGVFTGNHALLGGGAIRTLGAGSATITETTFDGNGVASAAGGPVDGGALLVGGAVTCRGCTFVANTATGIGGAVCTTADATAHFEATDSTFSANTAAQGGAMGVAQGGGALALASVTVSGNSARASAGGVAGPARLRNTIVAGNSAQTGPDCTGSLLSESYDLLGTNGDCTFTTATGDQVGTPQSPIAPGLGPLADNGGPTRTFALLAGSPAGEAGNPAGCTDPSGAALAQDQRGQPRQVDGDGDGAPRCDIGAYEAPAGTFPTPTTTTSTSSTSTTTTSTSSSTTTSTSTTSTSTSTTSTSTSTTVSTTTSTTATTLLPLQLLLEPCLLSGDDTKPTKIVGHGVTDWRLRGDTVFWHTPPASLSLSNKDPEKISRRPVFCGVSRQIFGRYLDCSGRFCARYHIQSNVVVDDAYAYWVDGDGLVRLPVGANPGDPAEVLTPDIAPTSAGVPLELAIAGDRVCALQTTGNILGTRRILCVPRAGGDVNEPFSQNGPMGSLAGDDEFLYVVVGATLERLDPAGAPSALTAIAGGVTAYFPEGRRTICGKNFCSTTKFVWVGRGDQLFRYNNIGNTLSAALYTSPGGDANIYGVAAAGQKVFVFETRTPPGGSRGAYLVRMGRTGASPAVIYIKDGVGFGAEPGPLAATELPSVVYVVWQDGDALWRLAGNADEITIGNLVLGDVEVTQSIQDLAQSVPLIKKKRTFVRAMASSAGGSVAGVTAYLYGTWSGGSGGPLVPVNPIGTNLTIQSSPKFEDLNHTFLFEVPADWTTQAGLRLTVQVNPGHHPLESDYIDNSTTVGPLTFQNSPRLEVQFVAWGFDLSGTTYYPRFVKDIIQTYSWVRRAYPLASTPGFLSDPGPGFHPNLWLIYDAELGSLVDHSSSKCSAIYPKVIDDIDLCASYYANIKMNGMRIEQCSGLPFGQYFSCINEWFGRFFYGMIPATPSYFPRGQACCAPKVSTGPATPMCCGASWDTDGAITDWYAGHEIGHTLGRNHPSKGNACGHSASDPSYPYTDALIGPSGGSLAGFDPGDGGLGIAPGVLKRSQWHDLMSYCSYQWISDYTFEGMLSYMGPSASALVAGPRDAVVPAPALLVEGVITADGTQALLHELRRTDPVGALPPGTGAYHLRLVDAGDDVLAELDFDPVPIAPEGGMVGGASFTLLAPFPDGTREVRIVSPQGETLGSHAVSANAPVVTSIGLDPVPAGPVGGTVQLGWTAMDADGDPLAFDVLYTRDDGATFRPILLGISATSALVDTSGLGGGTARLRVVASDGVLTGFADTAALTVATKPPLPRIVEPAEGAHLHYGQLVTLTGEAFDLQDGGVPGDRLAWSYQGGPIGTGAEIAVETLPVGEDLITLTATNADGLSATAEVHVVVDDDALPGPQLSVAPAQTGWQVAPGSGLVTDTLAVTNVGGGGLKWTAATDATWLKLGAAGGDTPGTLPISTDPQLLADGTSLTATIVLTALDGDGKPVGTVPVLVTLAVGDVWHLTSGTTPSTTTTTTLPPTTCTPPDCDDGDACTDDACVAGPRCTHARRPGYDGVLCRCGSVPSACAAATLPRGIINRFTRACTLTTRAKDAKGARVGRLLGQSSKAFRAAGRQALHAAGGRHPKLDPGCADALHAMFGELQTLARDLVPHR